MGKYVRMHQPCSDCGSSDALSEYTDGGTRCFSCWTFTPPTKGEQEPSSSGETAPSSTPASAKVPLILSGEYTHLTARNLDRETCEKYRYQTGPGVQIANYCDTAGRIVAQKLRYPADPETGKKDFRWTGDPKKAGLFGQQLWREKGKRIVIVEGEIDALSLAQAMNLRWPVVSVPNGAASAYKDLARHLPYLETYETVVLMFDGDRAGQEAAAQCATLFSPGKVAIAQLPLKDPNEMLKARRVKELVSAAWEARTYRPDGILAAEDLWEAVSTPPEHGFSYPWAALDNALYGQRKAEIVTWASGTGVGKTTVMRAVINGLLDQGARVGVLSFEDTPRTLMLGLLGLRMGARLHVPDVWKKTDRTILQNAFEQFPTEQLRVFCADLEAKDLESKIRHLVVAEKADFIVLDHITAVVTGTGSDKEWERIDTVMRKVRPLVLELGFGLHVVSHLTKADGTPFEEGGKISLKHLRGSALQRDSHAVIGLERDQQAEKEEQTVTVFRVLKQRLTGETGPAGAVGYDEESGRLIECEAPVKQESKGFPPRKAAPPPPNHKGDDF